MEHHHHCFTQNHHAGVLWQMQSRTEGLQTRWVKQGEIVISQLIADGVVLMDKEKNVKSDWPNILH